MTIPLNYRAGGTAPVSGDDTAAFNARRKTGNEGTIFAGGDFLYRIYPSADRVFFIKIDSGTSQGLQVTFGLLGLLIHNLFIKKKANAQAQERMASYAGQRPALLLGQDKANYVLQRDEITSPTIDPPSFWTGGKNGKFWFKDAKKKKRTFHFEDVENFQQAVQTLTAAFGNELTLRAQYDGTRNKVVKVKK